MTATENTKDQDDQRLSRDLRLRGVRILAVFGALWGVVAASGLTGVTATGVRIVAVAAAAGLVVAAQRGTRESSAPGGPAAERDRHLPATWRKTVGIVNGAQFVVIAAVVLLCVLVLRAPQLVAPLVAIVVGAHFWPLVRQFDQPEYRVTAVGCVLAGVAALVVLAVTGSNEATRVVSGGGAAVVLLGTAGRLVRP